MKRLMLAVCCGLALGCANAVEPSRTETAGKPITDKDNSAVNERDRGSATKTPLDQNENRNDITVTADIRKQIVDSKMSIDAENVKIITQDGRVTLRGPVKSEEEKQTIEKIAKEVAGVDHVDSQLEVEAQQ